MVPPPGGEPVSPGSLDLLVDNAGLMLSASIPGADTQPDRVAVNEILVRPTGRTR